MTSAARDAESAPVRSAPALLLLLSALLSAPAVFSQPLDGQIVADPGNPSWLRYAGGGPHFLAGAGDPENFLYRGARLADGTRDGDQQALIDKLIASGANGIYVQAVRSHGGDGDATHNPFIDNDPSKGLNPAVLDQWDAWFTQLDNAGVSVYFFFYDDGARIWNTGGTVGASERAFFEGLVQRFQHLRRLVWVTAEEYPERYTAARMSALAAVIRTADLHDHVIGVHKLESTSFEEFANDPNIDQFAMQLEARTIDIVHAETAEAWTNAAGRYNLNLAEPARFGSGQTARLKSWATVMSGAYIMLPAIDIVSTPQSDLDDLGRIVDFMESTDFDRMAPHDELGFAGTDYVLAAPGESYILYAAALGGGELGVRGLTAGDYRLSWFDPVTGARELQDDLPLAAGDRSWPKPSGFGDEVALHLLRKGASANVPPTAAPQSVVVEENASVDITLTFSDSDGPGPYEFEVTQVPAFGLLSGAGAMRSYMPNPGFTGTDEFRFTVFDGIDVSQPALVSITVAPAPVNTPPVAIDQSVTVNQDDSVGIQLDFQDADGPGPYTVEIVTPPANGTLSGSDATRLYTPDPGYSGADAFTWRVFDGLDFSNTAQVAIDVLAVDLEPPAVVSVSAPAADEVRVVFDEPVEPSSAQSPANYSLDQGAGVLLATLLSDGRTVSLTVTPLAPDTAYALTIAGIRDLANPPNEALSSVWNFTFEPALEILNLSRPHYEIGTLTVGELLYMDRGFPYTGLVPALEGAPYLRTSNDEKFGSGAEFLTFDVSQPAAVYVGFDSRFVPPAWLAAWHDTGEALMSNSAAFRLFARNFETGQVALGGNEVGGNMYVVAFGAPDPVFDDAPGPAPVTNVSRPGYRLDMLAVGSFLYSDRTFVYTELTPALVDAPYLQTENDDKFGSAADFLEFDLTAPQAVFVGYDERLPLPGWLAGWHDTGLALRSNDAVFELYARNFPAGRVSLGGNENGGNMYVVAFGDQDPAYDEDTGATVVNISRPGYRLSQLDVDALLYSDRSFRYTAVPPAFVGAEYLQTENDDKFGAATSFLSFDLTEPQAVLVGYDSRLPLPGWLASWTSVGLSLWSNDAEFPLYARNFPAGPVSLGGNENGGNMYVVVFDTVDPAYD